MSEANSSVGTSNTRRKFLTTSGGTIAAASTLSALSTPPVHAAGSDVLRLGLVGCGGRGTGAALQALTADPGTRLVAVADAFAEPIYACLQSLSKQAGIAAQVEVDQEHRFGGFEGYQRLLASDVDIVLLCTPPHFRPMQLPRPSRRASTYLRRSPLPLMQPASAACSIRPGLLTTSDSRLYRDSIHATRLPCNN